ncbi:MAG: DNA polymerase elongation subunit, partial [Planctomycetota bacterium]
MKTRFQVLDADYVLIDSKPTIRLFGRTDENKSITVFYDKFLPYFYVLPAEGKTTELKEYIKKKFKKLVVKMETTEKFLSIGYQEKPTKVLKITLNDPSKTPSIRDDLRTTRLVKDIYEADILFRYRFMTDHGIFGMRWYEVDGEGTRTNTAKTEKTILAKSFKEIKKEENMKFKYLSVDIETLSSEGGMPNENKDPIILISLFFYPSFKDKNSLVLAAKPIKKFEKDIMGFPSEKEMLSEFIKIIDRFDPDLICGYNISNFDLPYIEARLKKNNIPRTIGRCKQKNMRCSKFANRERVTIPGRIIVDVYSMVKEATRKFGLFKGLKRFGLGDVSKAVLGEGKVDVAHSEINGFWADNGEKLKKLLRYSRKDAELPLRVLMKKMMLDKFIEVCKVTGIVLQDALDSGETSRIENLLLREFNKRNFIIPCRPTNEEVSRRQKERRTKGLKGAFVLKPEVGFHDNCVVYLDFKSMYPSILINLNICPTTLLLDGEGIEHQTTPFGSKFVSPKVRRGIVPEILKYLIETRDKVKKEMKRARSPERKNYLYAKQYALKTVANAFYGYSGYIRARFYMLDIASGITSTGRDMIKKTRSI